MRGVRLPSLSYPFQQPALLERALTHRSHSADHYERLEFLGDGILNFVIAECLFQQFPQLPEGDLSRLRAQLVRQETLVGIAEHLQIGQALRLGEGELRSGGHQRPSILADAVEAVLGAIYLDGGLEPVQTTIRTLFADLLNTLDPNKALKDPKTRLQEWLQARKRPLPVYSLLEATGAAHDQRFQIRCELTSPRQSSDGHGASRRAAEQEAAKRMLEILEK